MNTLTEAFIKGLQSDPRDYKKATVGEVLSLIFVNATKRGFSREQVLQCHQMAEAFLLQQVQEMKRQQIQPPAAPNPVQTVLDQRRSLPIATEPPGSLAATGSSALTAPALTAPAEEETIIPPPRPTDKNQQELAAIGIALEQGFKHQGLEVSFAESCNQGLRCDKFIFGKPPAIKFARFEDCPEVLSHAGLPPRLNTTLVELPNNRFELHILRPKQQWRSAYLINYLPGADKAIPLVKQKDYNGFVRALVVGSNINPWDDLQATCLVDFNGSPKRLNLKSGAIVIGKPRIGKSVAMQVIAQSLAATYSPEHLEMIFIDFKHGLSFNRFGRLPHVRQEIQTNISTIESEDLIGLFKALADIVQKRGVQLSNAGCENIQQYNQKRPTNPMRWVALFVDEIAAVKAFLGKDLADHLFYTIASLWSAMGIVFVGGTQYPSQELALTPATRMCLGSAIALQASVNAAMMAFGVEASHPWVKMVPRLHSHGDCIAVEDGEFIRAQLLYLSADQQNSLIDIIANFWALELPHLNKSAQALPAHADREVEEAIAQIAQSNDASSTEVDPASGSDTDEFMQQAWLRIQAGKRAWKNKTPYSRRQMKIAAFGHEYENPENADSGSNAQRNSVRLDRILKRFEA